MSSRCNLALVSHVELPVSPQIIAVMGELILAAKPSGRAPAQHDVSNTATTKTSQSHHKPWRDELIATEMHS